MTPLHIKGPTVRTKIALRNLYISQSIIILFLLFAYLAWFPHSFSKLGGFNKTALMLIFVDLILGPLLVFIVYKENKKYLKFDINVLLAIQLVAFVYGAYALYLKHPAYAVFNNNKFTLTNVSNIYPQQPWEEQLKTTFFSSPKLVTAHLPKNPKERKGLIFDIVLSGEPDINDRPEFYRPMKENIQAVFSKSIPLKQLFVNPESKQILTEFIQKLGGQVTDYAYFPLSGNNRKEMIWVFDRSTHKPVGIIDSIQLKIAQK